MNRKMFAPGGLKLDDQGHIRAAFAQLNPQATISRITA